MKINKIKVITFSVIFSSIGALGSGCYYNAKSFSPLPQTPPNLIEEQPNPTNNVNEKANNTTDNPNTAATTPTDNQNSADVPAEKNDETTNPSNPKTIDDSTAPAKKNSENNSKSASASNTDSSKIKGQNIIPSAKSYAIPANEVIKMINNPSIAKTKTVFLTFDDGPDISKTPKILNILKENNVHATFFVLGSRLQGQATKNILIQTYKSGNAIANHSYSHNMKVIYPKNTLCVNTFMGEVDQTNHILKETLGPNFNCAVIRMPGGYISREYYNDPNLGSLSNVLKDKGFVSIDWNAENGDAVCKDTSVANLVGNVRKYSQGKKVIVLLMHDINNSTVQSLPSVIKYYKDNGYEFKVISN